MTFLITLYICKYGKFVTFHLLGDVSMYYPAAEIVVFNMCAGKPCDCWRSLTVKLF